VLCDAVITAATEKRRVTIDEMTAPAGEISRV
jgi:hypothetical protein